MTHPHTLSAYSRRHIDLHLTASALCLRMRIARSHPSPH
jgi:hypothetical protein